MIHAVLLYLKHIFIINKHQAKWGVYSNNERIWYDIHSTVQHMMQAVNRATNMKVLEPAAHNVCALKSKLRIWNKTSREL